MQNFYYEKFIYCFLISSYIYFCSLFEDISFVPFSLVQNKNTSLKCNVHFKARESTDRATETDI